MGTTGTARLQRRRIIERHRLEALLDASNSRVKLLVAPAGYGKTTLAEHWVAHNGRQDAWFVVFSIAHAWYAPTDTDENKRLPATTIGRVEHTVWH